MNKHLHIVCLDVPYPVNYGGVYDLFYKLVALKEAGVHIHLHCFEYGRGRPEELNRYCDSVHYYCRYTGHKSISHKLPYIVASRANDELLNNLLQDDHPVLLEGIHCSYLLMDDRFRHRRVLLRLHNVEYQYYRQLYHTSNGLLKKFYYYHESRLLKKYESVIARKSMVVTVSEQDALTYKNELGAGQVVHLPVFLPFREVGSREGKGCFCLYHGNLSVAENEAAAKWLLTKIFRDLKIPVVIAGKNPSRKLEKMVHTLPHACLVQNPSPEEMQDMIAKAQINLLPSFNCTGIKLKLLNALYNGRHCIVNEAMVAGTGLDSACHVANDAAAFRQQVQQLYEQPFTTEDIQLRSELLQHRFDNESNAQQLITWIW